MFNVIGWLGIERSGSAATQHLRFEVARHKMSDEARRRGRSDLKDSRG